jgi:hypothetical protein
MWNVPMCVDFKFKILEDIVNPANMKPSESSSVPLPGRGSRMSFYYYKCPYQVLVEQTKTDQRSVRPYEKGILRMDIKKGQGA